MLKAYPLFMYKIIALFDNLLRNFIGPYIVRYARIMNI